MDEETRKIIESNVKMLNSGIKLLCNSRLSSDMIENEFHAIELLVNDCKRLFYSTIEEN